MAKNDDELTAPPSNDAYTGMLSISLLALVGAAALLYLDYSQYPDKPPTYAKAKPDEKLPNVSPIAKTDKAPEKADFMVRPSSIELKPGADPKTIEIKNGKLDDIQFDMDAGISVEKSDDSLSFKISAGNDAKEGKLDVTIKGKNAKNEDKQAVLSVVVKKADKAE